MFLASWDVQAYLLLYVEFSSFEFLNSHFPLCDAWSWFWNGMEN